MNKRNKKTKNKIDREYQIYLGNLVSCQTFEEEEITMTVLHLQKNNF